MSRWRLLMDTETWIPFNFYMSWSIFPNHFKIHSQFMAYTKYTVGLICPMSNSLLIPLVKPWSLSLCRFLGPGMSDDCSQAFLSWVWQTASSVSPEHFVYSKFQKGEAKISRYSDELCCFLLLNSLFILEEHTISILVSGLDLILILGLTWHEKLLPLLLNSQFCFSLAIDVAVTCVLSFVHWLDFLPHDEALDICCSVLRAIIGQLPTLG